MMLLWLHVNCKDFKYIFKNRSTECFEYQQKMHCEWQFTDQKSNGSWIKLRYKCVFLNGRRPINSDKRRLWFFDTIEMALKWFDSQIYLCILFWHRLQIYTWPKDFYVTFGYGFCMSLSLLCHCLFVSVSLGFNSIRFNFYETKFVTRWQHRAKLWHIIPNHEFLENSKRQNDSRKI